MLFYILIPNIRICVNYCVMTSYLTPSSGIYDRVMNNVKPPIPDAGFDLKPGWDHAVASGFILPRQLYRNPGETASTKCMWFLVSTAFHPGYDPFYLLFLQNMQHGLQISY
jgi:hypothetical protein